MPDIRSDAARLASQLRREDYKAIKHMDKTALAAYLSRIWKRGYDTGFKAASERAAKAEATAQPPAAAEQEG